MGRRLKRCARSLYVSIPYGKGKARDVPLDFIKRGLVSIPYGKGKDTETLLTHDEIIEYQFPMGKVKITK